MRLVLLSLLILGTAQPLLPAAEPGEGVTAAAIIARGRLVVAQVAGERFPFFFTDPDGRLVGADIELAQAMADGLGVTLELERSAATFDEAVEKVRRGQADAAVSKLSVTLGRAAKVRFSAPYLEQHEALLVNRLRLAAEHPGLDAWAACQVRGVAIGVVRGTSFARALPELAPGAVVKEFADPAALTAAVVRGGVLAAFHDEITFNLIRHLRPQVALWAELRLLPSRHDHLAVALPAGDAHFAAWVDLLIERRGGPGSAEPLLAHWRSADPARQPRVVAEQAAAIDRAMDEAGAAEPPSQPRRWGALGLLAALLAALAVGTGLAVAWCGRTAHAR